MDMSLEDYARRDKKRGRDAGGHSGSKRRQDAGGGHGGHEHRGHKERSCGSGSGSGGGSWAPKRHGDGGGGGGGGGGRTPAGAKLDEEGYLWWDEATGVCTYFQDRRRKWPFTAGATGKAQLCALVSANAALRARNLQLLSAAGAESDRVAQEGERLYVEKPTLRGDANVTWSYDEYGHPGLQLYYLKLKAWQRFTETYALLERAGRRGLFDAPPPTGRPLRIAALGGGPGYELLAARHYLASRGLEGRGTVELINSDAQPTWKSYSEALGFRFFTFDIFDGGLVERCRDACAGGADDADAGQGSGQAGGDTTGGSGSSGQAASEGTGGGAGAREVDLSPSPPVPYAIDYLILSYVCIYVAKTPGDPRHESVCDELARLLQPAGGVRAVLVSERSEETAVCRMMEARGVTVERLMCQDLGRDERQSVLLSAAAAPLPHPPPTRDSERDLTFPNVPFEEHKVKRGGARGAGGSQTKWYS